MSERTFSWNLPQDAVQKLISLDRFQRMEFFRDLPMENVPIGALMGFSEIDIDDKGQVTFTITPQEFHYNPLGTVHGGLAATLLDSCNSISANCQVDKGFLTMTTDIRVNYLRPMTIKTGEVTASAIIEKVGRKVIFVKGSLADKDGNVDNIQKILLVDSVAAAAGGAAGISSNTSYIESAAGVGEGARTGLASIVTGIAFLLTTFLAPLVAIIPYEAATPALIIVGFLMMSQIKNINWDDLGIGIPAFLTIILMPFTYNISVGIGAGFVTHVVIRVVQGRGKELHPLLLLVSGLFMVYFLSSPINAWIG